MTIKELLTQYANRGYSRAMVRRELGWSRYRLDEFCKEYPDIPWKPFWHTIEYQYSLKDRNRALTSTREHMEKMWAAASRLYPTYSVLGMTGTIPQLHMNLVEQGLCTVAEATVRRRIREGMDLEQAFLLSACHRLGPQGWIKNKRSRPVPPAV